MSDEGNDTNNCQSQTLPCRNLQTVVDRAPDGAEIFVVSQTLSMASGFVYRDKRCVIMSRKSYTVRSLHGNHVKVKCPGDCTKCLFFVELKFGLFDQALQMFVPRALLFTSAFFLQMISFTGQVKKATQKPLSSCRTCS